MSRFARTDAGSDSRPLQGLSASARRRGRKAASACAELVEMLDAGERALLQLALDSCGQMLHDEAGRKLGKISSVLVDRETGRPTWLALHLPQHRPQVMVEMPVAALSYGGGRYWTTLEGTIVESAAPGNPASITSRKEVELCTYYGLSLTRGAELGSWDRRVTCAPASRDKRSGAIEWRPGPRASPSA